MKFLRNNAKISQEKLADAMNMSRSSIAMYETYTDDDMPNISVSKLTEIAKFFNVTVDFLLGFEDSHYAYDTLFRNGYVLEEDEQSYVLDLLKIAKPELYKKIMKGNDSDGTANAKAGKNKRDSV